jgi:hypothetical protein
MGSNCGAIDAVVAAVSHDLSERDRNSLPDPGFAQTPKPPIDRIPIAVFGWDIPPGRPAAKSPKYAVDDRTILLRTAAVSPIDGFYRQ